MKYQRALSAAGLLLLARVAFAGAPGVPSSGPDIQLYGSIDAGYEHLSYDNSSVSRLGSGIMVPDLIGVKGSQSLNGLTAFFQLETGFCGNGNGSLLSSNNVFTGANQGAQFQANSDYCTGGQFMNRLAEVGLRNHLGELSMGRLETPSLLNILQTDPFHVGMTGGAFNYDPAFPIYNLVSQGVEVQSKDFGGFTASALYAFGAQPNNASTGRLYNVSLNYRQGPLSGGVAYLEHNFDTSTPLPTGALMLDATGRFFLPSGGSLENSVAQVFGTYDLGWMKVSGYFADEKYGDGAMMSNGSASPNIKVAMLGATVPVGPGALLLSVGQHRDSNLDNSLSRQEAIGYVDQLMKGVDVFASYARMTNQSNVDQYVGDTTVVGSGAQGGASSSGLALGIRYAF